LFYRGEEEITSISKERVLSIQAQAGLVDEFNLLAMEALENLQTSRLDQVDIYFLKL